MDGDGIFIALMIFCVIFMVTSTINSHKEKKADIKERQKYFKEGDEREKRDEARLKNALSSMDKDEGDKLIYYINKHNDPSAPIARKTPQPGQSDYEIKFKNAMVIVDTLRTMNEEQKWRLEKALYNLYEWNTFLSGWHKWTFDDKFAEIKQSILNPTKEQLKQRKIQEKIDQDTENFYSAESLLEELKLYPLPEPVDKTGDYGRFMDFRDQIGKEITYKYLYLARVRSKIDDKKLIKIGITSNEDIEKRFKNDDVLELIEVIKSAKFSTKTAMALEYYLIRKYRPNDYFAEKEFDEFSRFSGYTEIIPMKHTTKVSDEIDSILKNSENIANAFQIVTQ